MIRLVVQKRSIHDVVQRNPVKVNVRQGPGGRSSVSGHTATVFGSTGFLGRYVVNNLAKAGTQVVIPYRGGDDERRHLKLMGDLGQIVATKYDLRDEEQIMESLRHSDVVYNLVGKDYETKNFTFDKVHVDGARRLARLAREAGVSKFVHVSALNANESSSSGFLRSKALGEKAVLEEFPDATIVRPGYMYGYEDRFWNRLGWFVKWSPLGFPIYNNGKTRMRPVYVGDVAVALSDMVHRDVPVGKTVELYGPNEYYLESIIRFFADVSRRKPFYTNFPKPINKFMATVINRLMFSPLITEDEVERYYIDDKPSTGAITFHDLQIQPHTVEETISRFVKLYQPEQYQAAAVEPLVKKYKIEEIHPFPQTVMKT